MLARHPIAGTITASLAGLVAGVTATVAVTPELSEAGGTDVIVEAPHLGTFGRGVIFAIGVAAVSLVVWAFASETDSGVRRGAIEVTAVSVGVGVLAGLGYRIVTAKSAGANIGGGIVLLASPVAALLFVGYVATRVRGMRASGGGHQRRR